MNGAKDADCRLRLARGFWAEARQDLPLARWRSAVDNAQLAIENAAKAVLAQFGPLSRSHHPHQQIHQGLATDVFPSDQRVDIERLAQLAQGMGADIHIRTDYGDELGEITPWELFDEGDARNALRLAEEAIDLPLRILAGRQNG
jgi:HEPN domain-containing protein